MARDRAPVIIKLVAIVSAIARRWKDWWLRVRQPRRVGAFMQPKEKGMSYAESRVHSDRLYPSTAEDFAYEEKYRQRRKKFVTDLDRAIIGVNAAAYMRWVETRKGVSPSSQETQGFVRGFLNTEGFTYTADEPGIIELSALASDVDTVDAFIKENRFFETLDQARSRENAMR